MPPCFSTTRETLLVVLLTNKPNYLPKTDVCERALSEYHKMVFTIFLSNLLNFLQNYQI